MKLNDIVCSGFLSRGLALIAILGGMAPASSAPQSRYSPQPTYSLLEKYRGYSCDALLKEARLVSGRASALASVPHSQHGVIASTQATVVLPAALDSTQQMAGEIAVLRQQMQAIEEAAIQGQCDIEFISSTDH